MKMYYQTKWHLFATIKKLLAGNGYDIQSTLLEDELEQFSEICFDMDVEERFNTSISSQFYFTIREKALLGDKIDLKEMFNEAYEECRKREVDGDDCSFNKLLISNHISQEHTDADTIKALKKIEDISGIYYLYDENKKLIYIGKSTGLGHRIVTSYKERRAYFFRYSIISNKADMHILEPYLISKYKPELNVEFIEDDQTSFALDEPKITEVFHHITYLYEVDSNYWERTKLELIRQSTGKKLVKAND